MSVKEQYRVIQVEADEAEPIRGSRGRGPLLLISIVLGLAASVTAVVVTRRRQQAQQQDAETLSPLEKLIASQYMNLTTFRKSGDPVVTPVWFAENAGTFYLQTGPSAGKVKRIRNSDRVIMTPSTSRGIPVGAPVQAHARVLQSAQEIATADAALTRKYGLQRTLLNRTRGIVQNARRKPQMEMAYLAITTN